MAGLTDLQQLPEYLEKLDKFLDMLKESGTVSVKDFPEELDFDAKKLGKLLYDRFAEEAKADRGYLEAPLRAAKIGYIILKSKKNTLGTLA